MFESIKHWFDSLDEQSQLFDDSQDETLHAALASVLYHIISADDQVVRQEKLVFGEILQQAFGLTDDQVDHLYEGARSSTSDLLVDLELINDHLKRNPVIRMEFMKKLNHLMDIDGVKDRELDIFYKAQKLVFPDIE